MPFGFLVPLKLLLVMLSPVANKNADTKIKIVLVDNYPCELLTYN